MIYYQINIITTLSHMNSQSFDPEHARKELLKLASYRMPYGKYAGKLLIELPEPYVVWYHSKGFPAGELGRMLGLTYEIKVNGLEPLFNPLKPEH